MLNVNFDKKNIYWEKQRGNNCRIHSLNAYFGEGKISDTHFSELCEEYDSLIHGLKSINMDGFAECRSIISFIVDKYSDKYCQLVPINLRGIHNKNRKIWNYKRFIEYIGEKGGINCYFEFNKDHVWCNKKIEGNWYKIDSLSGVHTINKLSDFGENGYFLVFEEEVLFYEIDYLINLVKEKCKDSDFESEIAFNNLYHLLKRVKLGYIQDTQFNERVSNIKTIYKILEEYVIENRKERINIKLVNRLKLQLNNVINFF
jgi:hypothetical protein